jgi:hypothetical protein
MVDIVDLTSDNDDTNDAQGSTAKRVLTQNVDSTSTAERASTQNVGLIWDSVDSDDAQKATAKRVKLTQNVDFGTPVDGEIYQVYCKEWYNKHKDEETTLVQTFGTKRQALLYCARLSFDAVNQSESCGLEDYPWDIDAILASSDDDLETYIRANKEVLECDHEGSECWVETVKIATSAVVMASLMRPT